MSVIKVTSKGLRLVASGAQKSTTRRGFRTEYTLGDSVFVCGEEHLPIIILRLEAMFFGELGPEHARVEGFRTVTELKKKIRIHYPEITGQDWVTHIVFILKEEPRQSQAV